MSRGTFTLGPSFEERVEKEVDNLGVRIVTSYQLNVSSFSGLQTSKRWTEITFQGS